jgi:hypothetical protein
MRDINNIIEEMREVFVSLERYELEVPQMKRIMYGAIGMIVIAVFSALISLVVRGGK